MIQPIWLKTYQTLVETRNFTKTAELLYMTQPGVSQHIKKLEEYCQKPLIQRAHKTFQLTEEGKALYQYAITLFEKEKAFLERIHFDNPHAGECIISSSGSLSLAIYPKLLELQEKHTELIIKLEASPNKIILRDLQENKIDLGIVTDFPQSDDFDIEMIGSQELCLILPKCTVNDDNICDKILELGAIHHPDFDFYFKYYRQNCGHSDLSELKIHTIKYNGYVNQIYQILLPIMRGFGMTVLPLSAIKNFNDIDKLTIYQPPKKVLEALYLVNLQSRILPNRYDLIKSTIKKEISEL